MMKTDIKYGRELKNALLKGAKIVSDAVGATMGPGGRLAISPGSTKFPFITKDGVSVAELLSHPDQHINHGVMMVVQACKKQVQSAGDGTTLTAVLAYRMLEIAYRMIESGYSMRSVVSQFRNEAKRLSNFFTENASKVMTQEELEKIGTIAANGQTELGRMIGEAVYRVGIEGYLIYEKNTRGTDHEIIYDDGIRIKTGVKYPIFHNCPEEGATAWTEKDEPFVFVTEHEFQFAEELKPLMSVLDEYNSARRDRGLPESPVLIISPDIRNYALQNLIDNIRHGRVRAAWIKPAETLSQWELESNLEDFAVLTGARNFTIASGANIKKIQIEDLGRAKKIRSIAVETTVNGIPDTIRLENRKNYLKSFIENSELKEGLEYRFAQQSLARLNRGMGTVRIGGQNETEQAEIYARVDDAVRACKAALEQGTLPGGGVSFLQARKDLYENQKPDTPGATIIYESLTAPIERILGNYGRDDTDLIIQQIIKSGGAYDMDAGYLCDKTMRSLRVLDPALVLSDAVLNSAAVVISMIQSDVSIVGEDDTNVRHNQ